MMNAAKKGFMLLPPAPGLCQECAVKHEPEQPHNQRSLYYQYRFYRKNGRWPTWADALAHCSPEVVDAWIDELGRMGVDVGGDHA